jgi:NADH-quinone oxidoreductase subunit J
MFLFVVFALIATVAALGVILSRKPVYSALFLLLNFATLAALYILLQAQFLAAVQIIVYAGAIVVLILFVLMLIGGGELGRGDKVTRGQGEAVNSLSAAQRLRFSLGWPRVTAIILAVLLVAGLGYGLITGTLHPAAGNAATFGQGSVEAIAGVLYTDYMLPFELVSVLLLVGMVGAVVLARNEQ